MNKKDKENIILEQFKNDSSLAFEILTLAEAQKKFLSYTGENPDFIIKYFNNYIGVELFRLCLKESKVDLSHNGKRYTNHMHKNSDQPTHFISADDMQEMLKNSPDNLCLTEQDDPGAILEKGIEQKKESWKIM